MGTIRTRALGLVQAAGAASGTLYGGPTALRARLTTLRCFVQGTPASVVASLTRSGVATVQVLRLIAPAANTLHVVDLDDVLEVGDLCSYTFGAGGTVSLWLSGTTYED